MGSSISTAVSKATQNTVQTLRTVNVNQDSQTIKTHIFNYLDSKEGSITIEDISNVIHTATSFASQLANATSDSMQAKTAQSIMQNLMTQIKDINLLQVGLSAADTACISNVTLQAFTKTANKCLGQVVTNVRNEIIAKKDITARNITSKVDQEVYMKCSSTAAVDAAVASSSTEALSQKESTIVSGVNASWVVLAIAGVAVIVVGPEVILTRPDVIKFLPAVACIGVGAGLIVYHYSTASKPSVTFFDAPSSTLDATTGVQIGSEVVDPSDIDNTVIGGSYTDYQYRMGKLYGYMANKSPDRALLLSQLVSPPLIAKLSDDRFSINVYTIHDPTKPVAAVSLFGGEAFQSDDIGVTFYNPENYYPPADRNKAMHLLYIEGKYLRLKNWSPKLQSWITDHEAVQYGTKPTVPYVIPDNLLSQKPTDNSISRYYHRSTVENTTKLYTGYALCAVGVALFMLPSLLASRSAASASSPGNIVSSSVGSRQ
ncbi:hypothetical protein [Heliothis virescens ascovirus 3g]|uniref:Uncharacterized protein n=1 Tax=Heliothis virescens ascovirus 3g TaxID=1246651 RepID=K4NVW6_9VIRU|nr:hypothetical protein F8204_gp056 [Heliothis virescens ascovirus 3g]AFV50308.1 hypothetical protein [Heliothis virescens ascovirus 3g]